MTDDERLLIRDKYDGNATRVTVEDRRRLASGEPLAYVIGWILFLDLRIDLSSKPLIPRPETEWWTNELLEHLSARFTDAPFRLLDLCAGSGAIGLSVLKRFPNAHVTFGELVPEHTEQIRKNIKLNELTALRTQIRTSDLFTAFGTESWDIIVSNPPYIPSARADELDASVTDFEPHEALFAGDEGLDIIRRILMDAPARLTPTGELWIECDVANSEAAKALSEQAGAQRTEILTDPYGRPRILVSYFR